MHSYTHSYTHSYMHSYNEGNRDRTVERPTYEANLYPNFGGCVIHSFPRLCSDRTVIDSETVSTASLL
jgi:hypothetical protein